MTLAAAAGVSAFVAGTAGPDQHPTAMLGALSVGVLMFPYTFGVVFALGIPLGCGAWIWRATKRAGAVSRTAWTALTAAGALGWILVGVAGALFSGA